MPFLWFNKAHWRSPIRVKGCCSHTFCTKRVTPSEQSPLRVLVNGGNSVPGGLTQLRLGQGLGRDWVRGASDCIPTSLSLSWVYLHVRPDCFMTMDYFLLLCSLLLPVVSAVEGKKIHIPLLFTMSKPFSLLPSKPAPIASQRLGAAAGEAPVYRNSSFFFCHPRIKLTFNFQSGHLVSFEGSLMALLALRRQSLWLVQVPVHNCYAHQRKLIHFNGSCVFLFVRSAIANCWCFSSSLKGTKRHTVTHRGVAAPSPPRQFLQVGSVYFKAVVF